VVTLAVRVTRLPDATEVTAVPPEVTARVVVVVGGVLRTVTGRLVIAVIPPEVPVTETENVPGVAVLLAVRVSTLAPVVGLGFHDAVTPLGSPDAARVTLPLNPYCGVT
jgi:hypothetical protein